MKNNESSNPHISEGNLGYKTYNIRDFGATGDGESLDTVAINAALENCHANGGGTVYMPPGVYLSGSLRLRSHTRLFLDAGATLKGSSNLDDYHLEGPPFFSEEAQKNEKMLKCHLLMASGENDICLEGAGTIDGGGTSFFEAHPKTGFLTLKEKYDERPAQMVYFHKCSNIRVQGLRLIDPTAWTLFFFGCEHVRVHGLYIDSTRTWTGDGLDIDCSRNVLVSDCDINSYDDSFTLRSNRSLLGDPNAVTEYVRVSNCIFRSLKSCGIRVGVGDGAIRNCDLSSLSIEASEGIRIAGKYNRASSGVSIEDLSFSNIRLVSKCSFLVTPAGDCQKPVRNIRFSNCDFVSSGGSALVGSSRNPVTNVTFDNVQFRLRGKGENDVDAPSLSEKWRLQEEAVEKVGRPNDCNYWAGCGDFPYGLTLENTRQVSIYNCRMIMEEGVGPWSAGIRVDNSSELCLVQPSFRNFENVPHYFGVEDESIVLQ